MARHRSRPLSPAGPGWSRLAARLAYVLIYGALAGLSVTGLVTTYLWFGMSVAHRALVYGLYALVTLHVSAVVLHDILHRAGLLRRMLPFLRPADEILSVPLTRKAR